MSLRFEHPFAHHPVLGWRNPVSVKSVTGRNCYRGHSQYLPATHSLFLIGSRMFVALGLRQTVDRLQIRWRLFEYYFRQTSGHGNLGCVFWDLVSALHCGTFGDAKVPVFHIWIIIQVYLLPFKA